MRNIMSLFFDYYSYFCQSVKKYDQYGFAENALKVAF